MAETTNIDNESLGELLRQKRFLLDLSLEDVEDKTGIKASFIKALETTRFTELPPAVYVQGYLKALSKIYGLEFAKLQRLYKEEQDLKLTINQAAKQRLQTPAAANLVITPKSLTTIVSLALFIIGGSYLVSQIKNVTAAPKLTIESPQADQVISATSLEIIGQTEPGAVVSINNQIIPVTGDGRFNQSLQINLGQNEVTIRSINRFNKYTEVKRRIVVGQEPEVLGESSKNEP